MIKPSEHGFVIRRETDPFLRAEAGEFVMVPAVEGAGLTAAQLELGHRIFGGIEPVDTTDPGWQVW